MFLKFCNTFEILQYLLQYFESIAILIAIFIFCNTFCNTFMFGNNFCNISICSDTHYVTLILRSTYSNI